MSNESSVTTQTNPKVIDFVSQKDLDALGIHLWDEIAKGIAMSMPAQLIPVVNEIFHRDYAPDADIDFLSTEYATLDKTGYHAYSIVLSDITFRVNREEIYHLEFQIQKDSRISIRIMEYDFPIALRHGSTIDPETQELHVSLPHSSVIYLTGNNSNPQPLSCQIQFPDGSMHPCDVPVVELQHYSLEEIRQKHLLMFLPFTFLRFRRDANANKKPVKGLVKELTAFLEEAILILDEEFQSELLSEMDYTEYMRLLRISADRVFIHQPILREEAQKVTERKLKFFKEYVAESKAEIASQKAEIADQRAEIADQKAEIADQKAEIAEKDALINELKAQLAQYQAGQGRH